MTSLSLIEQVRQIPYESILAYHGLTPRREGSTTRYKNDQYTIVTGANGLWFDNVASVESRGAIDLILHLKYRANPRLASDREFREAIGWLATFQPGTGIASMPETAAVSPAVPKESFASQAARFAIRDDAR